MPHPDKFRLLQIFNRYIERGGEEAAVDRIRELLSSCSAFGECTFESTDWTGANAPPKWRQAMLMIHNPATLEVLRKAHEAHRADAWLVHNVFPVGSAAIFREALKQDVPIIYWIHNFRPFSVNGYLWADDEVAEGGLRRNYWQEIRDGGWQDSVIKTAWFAFVLKLMHQLGWFKAVKAWVAISDFMREKFIEAGVPAADVFTVRHAWRPMDAPPPPQDAGHYLFLGRLIPPKGLCVLFEAWKIIREELGDRAPRLMIAGAGPSEAWVREKVRGNPLVEFCGSVSGDQKHQLIAACRAMIAPSIWWEPLGLVTYEAYDYGKPMLAARSGGLTETVVDGQTGFLHEPGNATELARQVVELDGAPNRRAEMGLRGRQWLLKNTNEDDWRQKIHKVVEHALGRVP
jgi:glycosyltransferase involved in cell wall biosynthesis